mgnify:CR=1 FL=1|tara:strand:- start:89 stop:943 length:855 start_codon:yes stop_codon:yes gene_type:complete
MESNNDFALNRLKILGTNDSFNKNSGSLIINGGMSCKKNLTTTSLNSECINTNNITVNNKLIVNKILPTDPDISEIGSKTEKFKNIYTNNIDTNNAYVNNTIISNNNKTNSLIVSNTANIGIDDNGNILLNVNNATKNILINVDNFTISNNARNLLNVSKSNIHLNSLLRYKYSILNIDTKCNNYNLYINSSIIIIKCSICTKISLMKKLSLFNNEEIEDGTLIKIYNKTNKTLIIDNNNLNSNSSIEFLYIINKWEILSCNFINNNNNNCNSSVFTNNNSICN